MRRTARSRKSRKQLQASLLVLSPRNGTFMKGVPVHMQDTPFTDTEPFSSVYVSVCLTANISVLPVASYSSAFNKCPRSSRHHTAM